MWTILILLAIWGVIGVLIVLSSIRRKEDAFGILSVITVILFFLCFFLDVFIREYDTNVSQERIGIVAIKDNSTVDGKAGGGLFIFSGYLNESPSYFYYKQVGNGYAQDSIKAEGVVIYEDTENGIGYITKTSKWYSLNQEWKEKYLHWLLFTEPHSYKTLSYEIHIPEGSIIKDFVLDGE